MTISNQKADVVGGSLKGSIDDFAWRERDMDAGKYGRCEDDDGIGYL